MAQIIAHRIPHKAPNVALGVLGGLVLVAAGGIIWWALREPAPVVTTPGTPSGGGQVSGVVPATDDEAPTKPTGVYSPGKTSTSVFLTWLPSRDNVGVVNYRVWVNGDLWMSAGRNAFANVEGLSPDTAYRFVVTALDAAGNQSPPSDSVTVRTLAGSVRQEPVVYISSPANNSVISGDALVEAVAFSERSGVEISKVEFYRASGSGQMALIRTDFSRPYNFVWDTEVNSNGRYVLQARAYDTSGGVSASQTVTVFVQNPAPDATAPVISAVRVTNVNRSEATIRWNTDEAANSQVEYGLSTSYGSFSSLDADLVSEHIVRLSGLEAATTYHFRVWSRDAAGNVRVSGDFTFRTDPRLPISI